MAKRTINENLRKNVKPNHFYSNGKENILFLGRVKYDLWGEDEFYLYLKESQLKKYYPGNYLIDNPMDLLNHMLSISHCTSGDYIFISKKPREFVSELNSLSHSPLKGKYLPTTINPEFGEIEFI
jgi:hypothetical protein